MVEIERYCDSGERCNDYDVCLTKDGSARVGDDKSTGAIFNVGSVTTVSFGGAAALWGTTWSQAEVTATTFGVLYKMQATDANADGYVDFIRVTIYYTAAASYSIVAAGGVYAISGTAASFPVDRVISAGAGSYALAGTAVGLLRDLLISATAGSYALTGSDVGLSRGKIMSAGAGSYALTGSDVSFPVSLSIPAGAGSYAITGTAANLLRDLVMQIVGGSYSITGQTLALTRAITMTAEAGLYLLSGTAVGLEEGGEEGHGRGAQVNIWIWWD